MSSAKITLLSFYEWMKWEDSDLFLQLSLPEGIDKDTLTENILMRGGEFEVIYSNPHFLQKAIGSWSKKWYRTFTRWIEALSIEYNPLENYDRMEDYSDTYNKGIKTQARRDSGNTRRFDNQDVLTRDSQDELTRDSQDELTHDTTDVTEREVSAYDSSTYQPAEKTATDLDGTDTTTHTGTDTTTYTGTDTTTHSGTIKDEYGEGSSGSETENSKNVHTGRLHGNIGVTTSQQMLEAELEIAKWNLYEHITDIFLEEFIIPIYS